MARTRAKLWLKEEDGTEVFWKEAEWESTWSVEDGDLVIYDIRSEPPGLETVDRAKIVFLSEKVLVYLFAETNLVIKVKQESGELLGIGSQPSVDAMAH